MKRLSIIWRTAIIASILPAASSIAFGQNSLPAPGSGGSYNPGGSGGWNSSSLPAPGSGGSYSPNPGWGPGVPPPAGWGSPWGGGLNVNIGFGSPDWQNQGVITVMGCGYDSMGIWRTLPMRVSYSWNGVQYNVTVLSTWNPWSDMWNRGIDMPAYNTSYYINGQNFNFYAPLSTGTYYFNL